MLLALILFALAAAGGVVMAALRFSGKPQPPLGLALVHGAAAAAGLVALIALVAKGGTASSVTTSLVLFLVAALGGFGLFSFHLRKLALPIWIMMVHALVGLLAFVILLVAALS